MGCRGAGAVSPLWGQLWLWEGQMEGERQMDPPTSPTALSVAQQGCILSGKAQDGDRVAAGPNSGVMCTLSLGQTLAFVSHNPRPSVSAEKKAQQPLASPLLSPLRPLLGLHGASGQQTAEAGPGAP